MGYNKYRNLNPNSNSTVADKNEFKPILVHRSKKRKGLAYDFARNITVPRKAFDLVSNFYLTDDITNLNINTFAEKFKKNVIEEQSFIKEKDRDKDDDINRTIESISNFHKDNNSEKKIKHIFLQGLKRKSEGSLQVLLEEMYEYFISKKSIKEVHLSKISDIARSFDTTNSFIDDVIESFKRELKSKYYIIDALRINPSVQAQSGFELIKGVTPKFDKHLYLDNLISITSETGAEIAINGVWAWDVFVTSKEKLPPDRTTRTPTFEYGLKIVVYDHFGLDHSDIIEFHDKTGFGIIDFSVFKAWFILQFVYGANPFVTYFNLFENVRIIHPDNFQFTPYNAPIKLGLYNRG